MKIKINVENLRKAVSDIDQIIKNNPIPISENLLISAENDSIILTVNNFNMKVNKRLPGEVLSAGKGLVHRDDLILLLKMKNDIELEFAGNQCTAKGNRVFSFTVNEKVDEFPLMAEVIEGEPDFAIPEKDLLYCMKLKKFVAASDSSRNNLRGMWIDENNIIACDGSRLGKIETNYHTSQKFMIPDFVLNYFSKALDIKSSELVVFYISENKHIKVRSDNFEIIYRQYDGDLFDYKKVLNVNNDQKKVVINKTDLTEAITFICKSGGSKPLNNRNPVVYTFNNNTFKVNYNSTNRHIEEEIPITNADENIELQIGFNPFNVSELLSLINGKQITMSFDKPLSASLVQSENEKEKYLVLPVRLMDAS